MKIYSPNTPEKSSLLLPVDVFARRQHFIDHLAPIWHKLNNRGNFYVPECMLDYARSMNIDAVPIKPDSRGGIHVRLIGKAPVLTCAYNDMEIAFHGNSRRALILMEHGAGIRFDHPGYAGGIGLRKRVHLFLSPNRYLSEITQSTFPEAPQVIIGTPKLDDICKYSKAPRSKKMVAISFHWNGERVAPEAGNALNHYIGILPALAKKYNIIGHGHPKMIDDLIPIYKKAGIRNIATNFRDVLAQADIYINDASSTIYEFCATGRPVIILNAPWFRRDVNLGLRFWQHSNVGINVDEPEDLIPAIQRTLDNPEEYAEQRNLATASLFPYIGQSASRAAQAISQFLEDKYNGRKFTFD